MNTIRILPLSFPKIIIILLLTSSVFSSCATLFTGFRDELVINSYPQGAEVTLNGKLKGMTPLKFKLKRSLFSKEIVITKDRFETEHFYLEKNFNTKCLFNLYIGTLPVALDVLSGSILRYDPGFYNVFTIIRLI